jgi:hypothetical protein
MRQHREALARRDGMPPIDRRSWAGRPTARRASAACPSSDRIAPSPGCDTGGNQVDRRYAPARGTASSATPFSLAGRRDHLACRCRTPSKPVLANPSAGVPFTVYNRSDRTLTAFGDMPAPADAAMLARESADIRVLGRAANEIIKPGRVLLRVQVASPFGVFPQMGPSRIWRESANGTGRDQTGRAPGGQNGNNFRSFFNGALGVDGHHEVTDPMPKTIDAYLRVPVRPGLRVQIIEGRHFDREVLCVRWYLRFKLSLRGLVEMMAERGLSMAHTTIMRWVQRYAPELEQRWRRFARAVGLSWRVDETYVKIRGEWCDRYRAVDRAGRTVDFRLSAKRDVAAAKGVLPQSAQRPAARPADNHIGRLRRISPCGARAESQWLAACQHEAALVEVPEQPD